VATGYTIKPVPASTTITPTTGAIPDRAIKPASLTKIVVPLTAAVPQAMTRLATANTTVTRVVAASGIVVDNASADVWISPTTAASATVLKPATANNTTTPVIPVVTPKPIVGTRPASATVDITTTADATVLKAAGAQSTVVDPSSSATGQYEGIAATVPVVVNPIPRARLGAVEKTIDAPNITITVLVEVIPEPIVDVASADLVVSPLPDAAGWAVKFAHAGVEVTTLPAAVAVLYADDTGAESWNALLL
jgi:hypothetical protein